MILFFFGENTFFIKRKIDELKLRYKTKWKDTLNMIELEGDSLQPKDFLSQIQAMPLLAETRLIIIKNIFSSSKDVQEVIVKNLNNIPDTTVIILSQAGNPDKRTVLFKSLSKLKNASEFKNFNEQKTKQFIVDQIVAAGSEISNDAVDLLYNYCPTDFWRLTNEIEKLINFSFGEKINLEQVKKMVFQDEQSTVFQMTDLLIAGKKIEALKILTSILKQGEIPLRIIALIAQQIKAIAQIKEGIENNVNKFQMAKYTSLNPYQISKLETTSRQSNWSEISKTYSLLAYYDAAIKTGKIEDKEALKQLILEI